MQTNQHPFVIVGVKKKESPQGEIILLIISTLSRPSHRRGETNPSISNRSRDHIILYLKCHPFLFSMLHFFKLDTVNIEKRRFKFNIKKFNLHPVLAEILEMTLFSGKNYHSF